MLLHLLSGFFYLRICFIFSEVKHVYQPIKVSLQEKKIKVHELYLLRCLYLKLPLILNIFAELYSLQAHGNNFFLQIVNTQFFEATEGLIFRWFLEGDGCELGCGLLDLPSIQPQGYFYIELSSSPWYNLWKTSSAIELFLTINTELKNSTRWADTGHIIASTQLSLPVEKKGPYVRISYEYCVYDIIMLYIVFHLTIF